MLLILAASTWLIGGTLLLAKHRERLGWPLHQRLSSKLLPFKNFDNREALILLGLIVFTCGFETLAAVLGP